MVGKLDVLVVFSSLTESSQLTPGQGAVYGALWCRARGWAHVCKAKGQGREREGEFGGVWGWTGSWELTPPPHTGSSSSGILMTAGRESLRQRKLSQATSCDRLARISFMAWTGPQIWKPQHYEAAHGKAFLAILSFSLSFSLPSSLPRMKWNRKHIICCAWSQTERRKPNWEWQKHTLTPYSQAIKLL